MPHARRTRISPAPCRIASALGGALVACTLVAVPTAAVPTVAVPTVAVPTAASPTAAVAATAPRPTAAPGPTAALGVMRTPAAAGLPPLEHSLHLASMPNARDLGGYVTADGRTVRSGVALRSDAPTTLSPADAAALQSMGLRTVIDLRTGLERALQKDIIPAGARAVWHDVVGDDPANLPALVDMPRLYDMFVTDAGAREAFRQSVLDIAYGEGATLFHCSAGKDRTGWLAAVLLTAVGVDRATVYDDFLASNELIGDGMAGPAAPVLDAAGSTFVNRVERGWLDTSFAAADRDFGGMDGYLRQGLGLTEADLVALEVRLLG